MIHGAQTNRPANEDDVLVFERRYGLKLPPDYREFLIEVANDGRFGPEYGLLPLATVPSYFQPLHAYTDRLTRSFPLTGEWVWEDERDDPESEVQIDRANDGVLLLGEEGCGVRWLLVVRGRAYGSVWFASGEGITPAAPSSNFTGWLQQRIDGGFEWWAQLPALWGPKPGIWFASHAMKQAFMVGLQRYGKPAPSLSQNFPLCSDCRVFLSRAALHNQAAFTVSVPAHKWVFASNGSISYE